MAGWLILAVGGVYAVVAVDLYVNAKPGMALAFVGYALANVGLWIQAK